MKGVSAIIATILMLVITIGLAGTAYVYISGMLTGKTAKTISLLDASCTGSNIVIVISNDGTQNIAATELAAYLDGSAVAAADTDIDGLAINAHRTGVGTISTGVAGTLHTVLITSPTNSGRIQVQC